MADNETADVLEQDGPTTTQENPDATATAGPKDEAGDHADPQGTPKVNEQDGEQKKRTGGWVRKLTRAEQERDFWREEALRNRPSASSPPPAAVTTQQPENDAKPQQGQFSTYEDFVEALSRWNARQEFKTLSAKEREAETKSEAAQREQEIAQSYRERVEQFAEEHDDFNQVVHRAVIHDPAVHAALSAALLEDDNGPALAYYLGQNKDVVDHINTLSPARAAAYIGRLAERLFPETEDEDTPADTPKGEASEDAPAPAPDKPVIQAPAPIRPVKKTTPTQAGTLRDELSTEEWMKRREKQIRG